MVDLATEVSPMRALRALVVVVAASLALVPFATPELSRRETLTLVVPTNEGLAPQPVLRRRTLALERRYMTRTLEPALDHAGR
jgi:hypothetical protein